MNEDKNKKESVEKFKQFVRKHPKMAKEVKEGKHTWKEFYEDWYIFGEEDDMWVPYKQGKADKSSNTPSQTVKNENKKGKGKGKSKGDFVGQFMNMMKNVDVNQLQHHITSINGAITNIQQLMEQFQSDNKQQTNMRDHRTPQRDPFYFKKD